MNLNYYIPINSFKVNVNNIFVTDIYPDTIEINIRKQIIKYFFRVSKHSIISGCLRKIDSRYQYEDKEGLIKKNHGRCKIEEIGSVIIDGKKISCIFGDFSLWKVEDNLSSAIYSGSVIVKTDEPICEKNISKEVSRFDLIDIRDDS